MLVTSEGRDLLKAVLGPARRCHPRAASMMLEGLALWHQRISGPCPLCGVRTNRDTLPRWSCATRSASASERCTTRSASPTSPARGAGTAAVRGLGDFRDLRQLGLPEVIR